MPGIGSGSRQRTICPVCSRQLTEKPVKLEIGKETIKCACGATVATGRREWKHASPDERRSYWSLGGIIPVLITASVTTGIVFGTWQKFSSGQAGVGFDLRASIWATLICAVLFGLDLGSRILQVRLSLRRCPEHRSIKV